MVYRRARAVARRPSIKGDLRLSMDQSALQAFLGGALDALKLPAWMLGFSMMGVGPLARDVGFSIDVAALSTILVFAGPAQVVFFGMIAAGASHAAIAFAVTLSAIRLLPMTAALMPLLRSGTAPSHGKLLFASHFVAVTVWVESMRRLPGLRAELRRPYFFGIGMACLVVATSATIVGYALASSVPPAVGAGLLFGTPVFFTLSLIGGARIRADWVALGLGFALPAIFGGWLGAAPALFLTGLIGGTVAFLLQRRDEAKASA